MRSRTLVVLSMLLDLKDASMKLFARKHKAPSLINFYVLLDICASLSNPGLKQNKEIFEHFLNSFAERTNWKRYSTHELWAARSSLVHSFSPIGYHTEKYNDVCPIFYYSWPVTEAEMSAALELKGYSNFLLLDVNEIKFLVTDTFNCMYSKIESDPEFENLFLLNSENLLPNLFSIGLENELAFIESLPTNT